MGVSYNIKEKKQEKSPIGMSINYQGVERIQLPIAELRVKPSEWEMGRIKTNIKINKICPICARKVEQSDYLNQIFKDEPEVNYLAHMVTHYRHNHIKSWNQCWSRNGTRYRRNWFGDYEEEKIKVNERAKRQILRKGLAILKDLKIRPEHFERLQNTEIKTLELAKKLLNPFDTSRENATKTIKVKDISPQTKEEAV